MRASPGSWHSAWRLPGEGGIDVAAALRPETHDRLQHGQLALVQASLGLALRDVYMLIALFAVGSIDLCPLAARQEGDACATDRQTRARRSQTRGMAVMASEL